MEEYEMALSRFSAALTRLERAASRAAGRDPRQGPLARERQISVGRPRVPAERWAVQDARELSRAPRAAPHDCAGPLRPARALFARKGLFSFPGGQLPPVARHDR